MSAFVPPNWFMGLLIYGFYIIFPLLVGLIVLGFCYFKFGTDKAMIVGGVVLVVCILLAGSGVLWWANMEVPSVHSEIVTVDDWQAKPNLPVNDNGMMVIDSADDLILVTADGGSYLNDENFLFQKFNTRDVLNKAKPGTVLNITSYGWREPFNNGFPNILSVEVVDGSHAKNVSANSYFGTKVVWWVMNWKE